MGRVVENTCYKCGIVIDEEDIVCCNCIDNTEGRNQHFWQIKDEEDEEKRMVYSKEEFLEVFDVSYEILTYNDVAAIKSLIEKFVMAKSID